MKIKRKQLNKIIYNYLNEGISDNDMLNEFSLKGQLKDKLNLDLDSTRIAKNFLRSQTLLKTSRSNHTL